MKKIINQCIHRAFGIAAACLLLGFCLMALGNTASGNPYGFATLSLAPCFLLLGYAFVFVGILKKMR